MLRIRASGKLLSTTWVAVLLSTGCVHMEAAPIAPTPPVPRLAPAIGAPLQGRCQDLPARLATLPQTRLLSATELPSGRLKIGGQEVPAHCLVTGKMHERVSSVDGQAYAIGFEMRLPLQWNGRFFHQGNGGMDGSVQPATGSLGGGPLTHALQQGFAVLSSDAGHTAAQNPLFGLDPQARLDYGYQAAATLTPMARQLMAAAYGKEPDRSYFGGCSNGGRHALVAAARLASQYDGFLAGAPGFNLPRAAIANIYGAQRYASLVPAGTDLAGAFTPLERTRVVHAVLARCDGLDGAVDGLVQDTQACQAAFQLARDVPTCPDSRDGSCLSAEQKTAIGSIFSGAVTAEGRRVYASFPYDTGLGAEGMAFWEFNAPLQLDAAAVGFVFQVPPLASAGFDGAAWALSADIGRLLEGIQARDATYTESGQQFMTPPHPSDLSVLQRRGAKLLVYHGVSDPIFSVDDTTAWYDTVRQANQGDASEFARFFRVPGMGHCSGGPATDQFDALTPLVAWVERGQAPSQLLATARGPGNAGGVNPEVPTDWAPTRSRPLCPYPQVARYQGSGSLEDAASFKCQ